MKTLILYQSFTGNTEKVTQQIRKALETKNITPTIIKITKKSDVDLYAYDLIFLGTPVIQWLPAKQILEFISRKMELHRKKGDIIPTSPKLPEKYAVCYCTYTGPHTGTREAIPAIKYMEQFFEHLRFSVLDEWYIVGEFINNEILSTKGVLGDTRGRPNENDLMYIEKRTIHIINKIKHLRNGHKNKNNLTKNFIPKAAQLLSKNPDVFNASKKLAYTIQNTSSLDKRTQELIKIVLSAGYKCKGCLKFHILKAMENGTADIEIIDSLLCGGIIGGDAYLSFAFEVIEELNLM